MKKKQKKPEKKNIKEKLKSLSKKVGYAALLPYKSVMVSILKKKGLIITMKDPIEKVSKLFLDKIIKKKQHLDMSYYETQENLIDDAVSIVKEIIDFFKNKQDSDRANESINDEDKEIAKKTKEIDDKLDKEDKGNWFKDHWMILSFMGLIFLIFSLRK